MGVGFARLEMMKMVRIVVRFVQFPMDLWKAGHLGLQCFSLFNSGMEKTRKFYHHSSRFVVRQAAAGVAAVAVEHAGHVAAPPIGVPIVVVAEVHAVVHVEDLIK